MREILLIEAFYGGSHKVLVDLLCEKLKEAGNSVHLITLSDRKWHWRARTGALSLALLIPKEVKFDVLFTSAVFNLSELLGLIPNLSSAKKILYFHENQITYPVQSEKERDVQYGYNQIISCLAADVVLFNSAFNRDSFLGSVNRFLKIIPDYTPKNIDAEIRPKSRVAYFPLTFPEISLEPKSEVLQIVWPHRWEHDKNPEMFFRALFRLKNEGHNFSVAVLGEHYNEKPDIFDEAKQKLEDRIVQWGYAESKADYWKILSESHVVVSTSNHEFFGVAMLEASFAGAYPLCPNRLVYPEIFPKECLYNTEDQLFRRLRDFSRRPENAEKKRKHINLNLDQFRWENLSSFYLEEFV